MLAASSRVLSGLSTAPSMGTAKCASIISGMLDAMIATVSRAPDAKCGQRGRQTRAAIEQLLVAITTFTIEHRYFVGKRICRAGEKTYRCQRHIVGRRRIKASFERMHLAERHWHHHLRIAPRGATLGQRRAIDL